MYSSSFLVIKINIPKSGYVDEPIRYGVICCMDSWAMLHQNSSFRVCAGLQIIFFLERTVGKNKNKVRRQITVPLDK